MIKIDKAAEHVIPSKGKTLIIEFAENNLPDVTIGENKERFLGKVIEWEGVPYKVYGVEMFAQPSCTVISKCGLLIQKQC